MDLFLILKIVFSHMLSELKILKQKNSLLRAYAICLILLLYSENIKYDFILLISS